MCSLVDLDRVQRSKRDLRRTLQKFLKRWWLQKDNIVHKLTKAYLNFTSTYIKRCSTSAVNLMPVSQLTVSKRVQPPKGLFTNVLRTLNSVKQKKKWPKKIEFLAFYFRFLLGLASLMNRKNAFFFYKISFFK